MEEVYVLCSVCEEAYRCPDALVNDGCDLGIQKPSEDELSENGESQLLNCQTHIS